MWIWKTDYLQPVASSSPVYVRHSRLHLEKMVSPDDDAGDSFYDDDDGEEEEEEEEEGEEEEEDIKSTQTNKQTNKQTKKTPYNKSALQIKYVNEEREEQEVSLFLGF